MTPRCDEFRRERMPALNPTPPMAYPPRPAVDATHGPVHAAGAVRSCVVRVLAMGVAAFASPAWAAAAEPLAVAEVRPGVFVHTGLLEDWGPSNGGDVANLGFIVGSRCAAVVDTGGTPQLGARLRAAVERATPLPICYVINTHAHPDHMLGSTAFVAAAPASASAAAAANAAATVPAAVPVPLPATAPKFVASASYARTLAARAPYYLNALQRDFNLQVPASAIVYPSSSVTGSLEIDLGDRVLTLRAWPTAHTDNDLTVFDHRTRTLFASDLLFVRHVPVLDGSLRGWLAVMNEMKRLDVATVVPGHGAVSHDWPAALDAQADYLGALLRDTRAAIRSMQPIQEAVARIAPSAGSAWVLTDRFHRRNLTAAYAELEWEDDAARSAPGPTPAASATRPGG